MLQCARRVQPCVTACLVSAILHKGVLGECCFAVTCCSVLDESTLVLRLISSEQWHRQNKKHLSCGRAVRSHCEVTL